MIRKLLVLLLCLTAATATAKKPKSSASKKAESSAEKPKESDYDKLFKEKHTVADGMFRLHDVKGKLYFEIPDSLFGREMLLGSTISEVSDNAAATTGSKSDYPLHVVFTRNDRSVQLRTVNCENITDETGASRALAEAVKRNTADPILRNYKIEAWNRDSTAVVVNVTDLFVADVEEMVALLEVRTLYGFRAEEDLPDGAFDAGRNQGFQRQCGGAQYVELYFHAHPRPHDAGQGPAADGRDDPVRWCCCPASLTVRASPTAACRCSRPARCFSASASSAPR